MRVIEVRARRLFARTRVPGFDYCVNQYVGCGHACRYCYAKFVCRWKGYGPWGTWVEVKVNAPELAAREVVSGRVAMSTISDPYQPVEAELRLTRRVLQSMDRSTRLSILTKSPLVVRDADVMAEFPSLEVGLTLSGLSEEDRRWVEPLAPPHRARVRALERLADAGLRTYAFISPVIPGVVDPASVAEEARDSARHFYVELLNLRASGASFRRELRERRPDAYLTLRDPARLREYVSRLREELEGFPVRAVIVHGQPLGLGSLEPGA